VEFLQGVRSGLFWKLTIDFKQTEKRRKRAPNLRSVHHRILTFLAHGKPAVTAHNVWQVQGGE
jgi:hypothetical protein